MGLPASGSSSHEGGQGCAVRLDQEHLEKSPKQERSRKNVTELSLFQYQTQMNYRVIVSPSTEATDNMGLGSLVVVLNSSQGPILEVCT